MLTQMVANRVYDFSHQVGGREMLGDVALAILGSDEEDTAFDQEQLERYQEELGLTDPLLLQYAKWVWSMVNGEFGGRSLVDREGLASIIGRRSPSGMSKSLMSDGSELGPTPKITRPSVRWSRNAKRSATWKGWW